MGREPNTTIGHGEMTKKILVFTSFTHGVTVNQILSSVLYINIYKEIIPEMIEIHEYISIISVRIYTYIYIYIFIFICISVLSYQHIITFIADV